jgi:hypothetical protein
VAPTEQIFLFINETPTRETWFFSENVTALLNMWLILVTNLLNAAGSESFVFKGFLVA